VMPDANFIDDHCGALRLVRLPPCTAQLEVRIEVVVAFVVDPPGGVVDRCGAARARW
jgi:hypothetical protein